MATFGIACECGNVDIITRNEYGHLKTEGGRFAMTLNVHSVEMIIICNECGAKIVGEG